jgi:hypothetical protein
VILRVAVGDEVQITICIHVCRLDPGTDTDAPREISPLPRCALGIRAEQREQIAVLIVETAGGSHLAAHEVGQSIAVQIPRPDVLRTVQVLGGYVLDPELGLRVERSLGPENSPIRKDETFSPHHIQSAVFVDIEADHVLNRLRE